MAIRVAPATLALWHYLTEAITHTTVRIPIFIPNKPVFSFKYFNYTCVHVECWCPWSQKYWIP